MKFVKHQTELGELLSTVATVEVLIGGTLIFMIVQLFRT